MTTGTRWYGGTGYHQGIYACTAQDNAPVYLFEVTVDDEDVTEFSLDYGTWALPTGTPLNYATWDSGVGYAIDLGGWQ